MKNVFSSIIAITIGVLLTACDQDPMAKKAAELQNAKPVGQLPEKPDPIESKAIQMTHPNTVSFSEEVRSNFVVSARVLEDGYNEVQVEVENLAEFDDATFDAKSGSFNWTPKKGTISTGVFQEFIVKLRAYAIPKNPKGQVLTQGREVRIYVNKTFSAPKISKITKFPETIREGESEDFYVEVIDLDSGADEKDIPIVQFFDLDNSQVKVSSTIRRAEFGHEYFAAEKRWKFHYFIDLEDMELTSSSARFKLGVRAINKYGMLTAVNELEGKVFTDLSILKTNWDFEIRLRPGVVQTITFLIYDPKGEADLTYLDSTFTAVAGATLTCDGDDVKICQFTVTPKGKSDDVDTGYFKFDFESNNKDFSDTEILTKNFYLSYFVEPINPPKVAGVRK